MFARVCFRSVVVLLSGQSSGVVCGRRRQHWETAIWSVNCCFCDLVQVTPFVEVWTPITVVWASQSIRLQRGWHRLARRQRWRFSFGIDECCRSFFLSFRVPNGKPAVSWFEGVWDFSVYFELHDFVEFFGILLHDLRCVLALLGQVLFFFVHRLVLLKWYLVRAERLRLTSFLRGCFLVTASILGQMLERVFQRILGTIEVAQGTRVQINCKILILI
jgi:hypothetical protein